MNWHERHIIGDHRPCLRDLIVVCAHNLGVRIFHLITQHRSARTGEDYPTNVVLLRRLENVVSPADVETVHPLPVPTARCVGGQMDDGVDTLESWLYRITIGDVRLGGCHVFISSAVQSAELVLAG